MNVNIDITRNLREQFEYQFKLKEKEGEYFLDSSVGSGESMECVAFPGKLEFYHFKPSLFKVPIEMKSVNPPNTEWLLLHINLSKKKHQKRVGNITLDFQKYLPMGLLLYGPGLEIDTLLPANVEMELASIHFHFSFLDTYFENWRETIGISKNLVYEDLDYRLERLLYKALSAIRSKIDCHAHILNFMSAYFQKLSSHSKHHKHESIHTADVKSLFIAAAHLRDPLSSSTPSLDSLATISNMSVTKFKTSFKQLFGSAPLQYRHRIRMEYAREELVTGTKVPTELSYELGYAHPSNFTAAYKKHFDALPSSEGRK